MACCGTASVLLPTIYFPDTDSRCEANPRFARPTSVTRPALIPSSNRVSCFGILRFRFSLDSHTIQSFARFCILASVSPTSGPYVFIFSVVPPRYCHRTAFYTNFLISGFASFCGLISVLPQYCLPHDPTCRMEGCKHSTKRIVTLEGKVPSMPS